MYYNFDGVQVFKLLVRMNYDPSVFASHYGEQRRRKKRPFRIHQNKVQNDSDLICESSGSQLIIGSPPPICETGATLLDEEGFPLWKLDESLTDEEGYPALSLQSTLCQGRPTAISAVGRDGGVFPRVTEHSLTIPWRPRSSYREISSYSYPCDRHVDLESGERTVRKVSPVRRLQRRCHGSDPEVYGGTNLAGTNRCSAVSRDGGQVSSSSFCQLLNDPYEPWFGEMAVRMSRREQLEENSALENTL